MDLVSKQIIKELAIKYGVSVEQMTMIQEAPYHFLRHVMTNEVDRENKVYPSVRIMGLAIFYAPEYVVQKFNNDETI